MKADRVEEEEEEEEEEVGAREGRGAAFSADTDLMFALTVNATAIGSTLVSAF